MPCRRFACRARVGALAIALVAGCAPPEADRITASAEAMQGPAPRLVPTEDFARAVEAGAGADAMAAGGAGLSARAAAVRRRARALDGPVVGPGALPRLQGPGPQER